jgi:hypothetical protein
MSSGYQDKESSYELLETNIFFMNGRQEMDDGYVPRLKLPRLVEIVACRLSDSHDHYNVDIRDGVHETMTDCTTFHILLLSQIFFRYIPSSLFHFLHISRLSMVVFHSLVD